MKLDKKQEGFERVRNASNGFYPEIQKDAI